MLSDQGTHGWNATSGDFPRYCTIASNLIYEPGIWEKQSSCTFSALSAQNNYTGNVCFNLPRAGFEFNDGMGGGDVVSRNLIFNGCRETSDHVRVSISPPSVAGTNGISAD